MNRFLAILAFIGLLFAACEPTVEQPVNGGESNLIVNTSIIVVDAEGGEGEILYTISQPVEGVKVEVTTTSEWISDIM